MLQNLSFSKFRNLEKEIDSEICRIDSLLSTLKPRKLTVGNVFSQIQNRNQRFDNKNKNIKLAHIQQLGSIVDDGEYVFQSLGKAEKEQQILLQNYEHHYDHRYVERISLSRAITMNVQTKSNWIAKYLDQGDCSLHFQFNSKQYQIRSVQSGVVSCFGDQKAHFEVDIDSLYSSCDLIEVRFVRHLQGYTLSMVVQNSPQVYSFTLSQGTRLILGVSEEMKCMHRVVLLRQRQISGQKKLEMVWGDYFKNSLLQSVWLQSGCYILVSLGTTPMKQIEVILQDINLIELRAATEESFKTKHLLDLLFDEYIVGTSRCMDESVAREYTRNVYMDIGLVLETYENIYRYEAKFQNQTEEHEDLQLLFPQLYTQHQLQNRYRAGEHITKFFSIEQKPAHLFVPRKYVLMGSKIMGTIQAHSVFK